MGDRAIAGVAGGAILLFIAWAGTHSLLGPEPGEREAQLRQDSMVLACELMLTQAAVDTLASWLRERNAQFETACGMLPFGTVEECRAVVDARTERKGSR